MLNLKMLLATTVLASTLLTGAQAQEGLGQEESANDEKHFTIASMDIEEIAVDASESTYVARRDYDMNKSFGEVIAVVDGMIALGKKIWPIVEAGRPVVSASFPKVDVLPQGKSAFELDNWYAPTARKWRVTYKNLYGMSVVQFTYGVHFQYGGQNDGKGRYLAAVTVDAEDVYVAWGYTFNASAEAVTASNRGTRANPVAGLTLRLNYEVSTVLSHSKSTRSFHVTGRGEFERL